MSGPLIILEIPFEQEQGYIYFDTIYMPNAISYSSTYSPDEVKLTATLDDLYYRKESIFAHNGLIHPTQYIEVAAESRSELPTSVVPYNGVDNYLTNEEIEAEVLRIRAVWTENQNAISNKQYRKEDLNFWYDAYYDGNDLKEITVKAGLVSKFTTTWQVEDGQLTFAFYDSVEETNRLYFKDGQLFRWIYATKKDGKEQKQTIYDNAFDKELFIAWEEQAFKGNGIDLETSM